ncbi:MAG TPA: hypothetical protein VG842_08785 [Sediminibacterium sp.]|nr:hypothetical protein [Sediminibacterium sp.]
MAVREKASRENPWFIPQFIDTAVERICSSFLDKTLLGQWADQYQLPARNDQPQTLGLVMAGNIPLVGFHDFLCGWISGHRLRIKTSSKDHVLFQHLLEQLTKWSPDTRDRVRIQERLSGCDAYIATGSNNTGRYFAYYFGKYPHIIRRNRTSVAILDGTETPAELKALAEDIQLYFGLGCRNVTQLYVPPGYDFLPLLEALRDYSFLIDHHKYKHNYDYHLALLIMGNKFYMTNDSVVLTENPAPFAPVSQVHYVFETDPAAASGRLLVNPDIQCIVGHGHLAFGQAQTPGLTDYADGVDTLAFLSELPPTAG